MKTEVIVGAVVVAGLLLYVFQPNLPSIASAYLAPTTPPDFPSPTETTQYPDPPASDPAVIAQNLPPLKLKQVCSISTLKEYNKWSPFSPTTSSDFAAVLSGVKARAGCFAPPT